MVLYIYRNKRTKLFSVKHPDYGFSQYTTWSMLKSFYKREYGIFLPSIKELDFKYTDFGEFYDVARILA